jgi:hypothetical protein
MTHTTKIQMSVTVVDIPAEKRTEHFPNRIWWAPESIKIWWLSLCLSVRPSVRLSIYLSIYGCTAPVDLGRFFSFLIYTESIGLLGRGISPSQGRYLHTEQHKHKIIAHRRPFHECDSNPRSQFSSGRRQFMSHIVRPLLSAEWAVEAHWTVRRRGSHIF